MCSADRAIGVLAQLQLAELHAQGVYEQQAAYQRFAFTENELDDLGRLNDAEQSGQNSEHTALRARRDKPRRRRFRIEATVARAFLGGEDAGLPFKAEDGGIGIRLSAEHAGIVDEIARGEIVRAVGDDVVVLD